jgi:hypothetical protein
VLTIFGPSREGDIPLASLLVDTLGDDDASNDVWRYVWDHGTTRPSPGRRLLASVPFLYHAFPAGRCEPDDVHTPALVLDLAKPGPSPWARAAAWAAQVMLLDPHGWILQSVPRTYRRNSDEYRQAHLQNLLQMLADYRFRPEAAPELMGPEVDGAIARGAWGGLPARFVDNAHAESSYARIGGAARQRTARNWELLRQRCEEEGLVFQPMGLPGAAATHALVWVAPALGPSRSAHFDGRFLNIDNPWKDHDLAHKVGYSRTAYQGPDGRWFWEQAEGTTPQVVVPLALYGLDFPRIPVLLVDFRATLNAKRREASRRIIDDVGRFLLGITPTGDAPIYALEEVVTLAGRRRGLDLDQPTRAASCLQLANMLGRDDIVDDRLRGILAAALEQVLVNPLEGDLESARARALASYRGLLREIDTGKVAARLDKDRGTERAALGHGRGAVALHAMGRLLSFGLYRHRHDDANDEYDYAVARSLRYHHALLERVSAAPGPIEVSWAPDRFLPSLDFVARFGRGAGDGLTATVKSLYDRSSSNEVRQAALSALRRIDTPNSREVLALIAGQLRIADSGGETTAGPSGPPASVEAPAPGAR